MGHKLASAAAGGHRAAGLGTSYGVGKRKKMIKKKRKNGADMWVICGFHGLRVYLRYLFYPGVFNPVLL
jgi:hypothetical protein